MRRTKSVWKSKTNIKTKSYQILPSITKIVKVFDNLYLKLFRKNSFCMNIETEDNWRQYLWYSTVPLVLWCIPVVIRSINKWSDNVFKRYLFNSVYSWQICYKRKWNYLFLHSWFHWNDNFFIHWQRNDNKFEQKLKKLFSVIREGISNVTEKIQCRLKGLLL